MRVFGFLMLLTLLLVGSQAQSQTEDYFNENIAITDLTAVTLANGQFYYQLQLKDFGKNDKLPEGFGFYGYTFMDNGEFNDKVKGDGIYSAQQTKPISILLKNPIKNKTVYSSEFKHTNKVPKSANKGVGCKFKRCGCPCDTGTMCDACRFFGWDCWKPYDCEFIIDIVVNL